MDFSAALSQSTALAAAVVFAGGLLTALTPCVYPLIPITVGIFGARSAERRARAAALSATYVLGMALMYSALGLGAALTGRVFGQVMANRWVVALVALVFAAFAASMFGAFEIALPSSWQGRLSRVGRVGFLGALAMGLVAGVIAAPCTGPVLGGVLAWVATTRDAALGFGMLFLFALGMGLPFFLIGAFAVSLPKGGSWMDGVKSVLGIVLLATALWFLKDAFPALKAPLRPEAPFVIGASALAVAGLLLGAVHRSFHGAWKERALKGAGVLCAVVGLYGSVAAATLPPPDASWIASEPQGVALARREGKPALIDFTADWCAACKELEARTYPTAAFRAEARRFVLIRVDGTAADEEFERLSDKYGVAGLPLLAFVDSRGNILADPRVQGFVDADELVRIMRRVQ